MNSTLDAPLGVTDGYEQRRVYLDTELASELHGPSVSNLTSDCTFRVQRVHGLDSTCGLDLTAVDMPSDAGDTSGRAGLHLSAAFVPENYAGGDVELSACAENLQLPVIEARDAVDQLNAITGAGGVVWTLQSIQPVQDTPASLEEGGGIRPSCVCANAANWPPVLHTASLKVTFMPGTPVVVGQQHGITIVSNQLALDDGSATPAYGNPIVVQTTSSSSVTVNVKVKIYGHPHSYCNRRRSYPQHADPAIDYHLNIHMLAATCVLPQPTLAGLTSPRQFANLYSKSVAVGSLGANIAVQDIGRGEYVLYGQHPFVLLSGFEVLGFARGAVVGTESSGFTPATLPPNDGTVYAVVDMGQVVHGASASANTTSHLARLLTLAFSPLSLNRTAYVWFTLEYDPNASTQVSDIYSVNPSDLTGVSNCIDIATTLSSLISDLTVTFDHVDDHVYTLTLPQSWPSTGNQRTVTGICISESLSDLLGLPSTPFTDIPGDLPQLDEVVNGYDSVATTPMHDSTQPIVVIGGRQAHICRVAGHVCNPLNHRFGQPQPSQAGEDELSTNDINHSRRLSRCLQQLPYTPGNGWVFKSTSPRIPGAHGTTSPPAGLLVATRQGPDLSSHGILRYKLSYALVRSGSIDIRHGQSSYVINGRGSGAPMAPEHIGMMRSLPAKQGEISVSPRPPRLAALPARILYVELVTPRAGRNSHGAALLAPVGVERHEDNRRQVSRSHHGSTARASLSTDAGLLADQSNQSRANVRRADRDADDATYPILGRLVWSAAATGVAAGTLGRYVFESALPPHSSLPQLHFPRFIRLQEVRLRIVTADRQLADLGGCGWSASLIATHIA